ncbi:D-alanyl-D-alanine dipeptidase [Bernardetia litoralis DSM 6794]|uniref:D-alanyl-D-alanine dipeptidase n=1 Tax=Bernardetia litoralis (strain ATCC 23117 / DSM 6794 / NBRC 15988 / NCIMB 1366 / Fx l1 / Sio-4) TaxID=880071 RepID=I4AHJ2_BERLS|nr:M15 family metallopeptidase [Bernardetia litoralis]AFM03427.1 D-alanyl-D-alanine dipeptidase [Bernardetia litoralis DSM 6794]
MKNLSYYILFLFLSVFYFSSCSNQDSKKLQASEEIQKLVQDSIKKIEAQRTEFIADSLQRIELQKQLQAKEEAEKKAYFEKLEDSVMVELINYDSTLVLDIRYATEDNFMKQKVYPCAKALLRKVAAEALFEAHQKFKEKGYRIKIYDGYRPLSVQWILWNTTTNKNYVANPRKGSNHNKGCAVDMTLVDSLGNELNMGTGYDFFGKEAHHTFTAFPIDTKDEILKNRKTLKTIMASVGFSSISNEWWHYNFKIKYPVSDTSLPCE